MTNSIYPEPEETDTSWEILQITWKPRRSTDYFLPLARKFLINRLSMASAVFSTAQTIKALVTNIRIVSITTSFNDSSRIS
ncbi:MAG: hypothetical protein F6K41_03170 [Symploca sp. SIO3E6]|nr:hypothetical protein [Caldora sp. SIO3E6]